MFFITSFVTQVFISSYFLGEMNSVLNYIGKADLVYSLIQQFLLTTSDGGRGFL